MLSTLLRSLGYLVASALLGLLSITDMLGADALSTASQALKRALRVRPDLAEGLAAAAR